MSNSPLNFGFMSAVGNAQNAMMSGIYGNMSDEDLQSQYDSYSALNPAFQNSSTMQNQLNAMQAELQRRQNLPSGVAGVTDPAVGSANLANVDYGIEANPMMGQAQVATGAPGSDMGNFSDGSQGYGVNRFGGFAGTTGGGTMTAGMAMGNAPLPTAGGGFNVQTEAAAQGVFGDPEQREAAMGAAERLSESLDDPITKSRKLKRKRLRGLESGMRGFGFVPGDIL